jgi:hypothetical protein
MTNNSAQQDVRLLQLDAIAENLAMVSTFAAHGADHAGYGDEAGLQASLFRAVKALNAALDTWRDLKAKVPEAARDAA